MLHSTVPGYIQTNSMLCCISYFSSRMFKLPNGFISGCTDCNREENILAWPQFMKPKIIFGLPLEKMDGVERSHFMVQDLLLLLSQFYEANQEVLNYFPFCSNKALSESYNYVIIEQVEALLKLYASEKYILMVNQQPEDLRFYVSFKVCFKFPSEN